MLENQLSRYKNAVGKPNVGSKILSNELPRVQEMSNNAANSGSVRNFAITKQNSAQVSEGIMASRGPMSNGSAAGFKGGKSAYLQMNGGGYSGASRRFSSVGGMDSIGTGIIPAKKMGKVVTKDVGRLSGTSMSRMSKLKILNRLV
jgi:hypothetical protein